MGRPRESEARGRANRYLVHIGESQCEKNKIIRQKRVQSSVMGQVVLVNELERPPFNRVKNLPVLLYRCPNNASVPLLRSFKRDKWRELTLEEDDKAENSSDDETAEEAGMRSELLSQNLDGGHGRISFTELLWKCKWEISGNDKRGYNRWGNIL